MNKVACLLQVGIQEVCSTCRGQKRMQFI